MKFNHSVQSAATVETVVSRAPDQFTLFARMKQSSFDPVVPVSRIHHDLGISSFICVYLRSSAVKKRILFRRAEASS